MGHQIADDITEEPRGSASNTYVLHIKAILSVTL